MRDLIRVRSLEPQALKMVLLRCLCSDRATMVALFVGNFDPQLVVASMGIASLESVLVLHFVVVGVTPLGGFVQLMFSKGGELHEFCLGFECNFFLCCCVGAVLLLQVA
jgi:hypothetical protein